jgi:replicative DNA helicase
MNESNLIRDPESEEAVLQALYLNPELIYDVDITVSDFTNPEYRLIYQAMLKLYSDGVEFDLKAIKDIESSINVLTISKIFSEAITSANIWYHAKKLKEKTFNRRCKEILKNLWANLGDEDFLSITERTLLDLHEFKERTVKHNSLSEMLYQVKAEIAEVKKLSRYGIPTGFESLNEACIGLCQKHLWLLGGYTAFGKSTLLSQIVINICDYGAGVLIFSCEDSYRDKLIRLFATKTDIPMRSIIRGYGDEAKLVYAQNEIEGYNLHIYDDIYTLEEMELKVKKHKLKDKIDVVAIDFVQNIMTGGESIYDRMSEVAIKLQRIAKKHNICIFALSQISETTEKAKISLRGAQELASAADIVLWIDRKPDEKRFNLIIRKNRPFGKTGKIPMTFTEKWTGIEEIKS